MVQRLRSFQHRPGSRRRSRWSGRRPISIVGDASLGFAQLVAADAELRIAPKRLTMRDAPARHTMHGAAARTTVHEAPARLTIRTAPKRHTIHEVQS